MATDLIKTGLIGRGIQASRSPSIHTKEAAALGLKLTYSLLDLDEPAFAGVSVDEVLAQAEADGFAGVNVTYPFKQAIIPLLNDLSEDAQRLGAVNTVVFGVEGRVGHNTDWFGFAEGFRRGLPGAALNRAVQLGAGGAGSAIAYALLDMGVQHLVIFDIDTDRALDLVLSMQALFGEGRVSVGADKREAMALADGVINATPVGMAKYPGSPLPVDLLRPSHWVAEVVYFPLETELLKAARAIGCRTVDGGGMAVFQAAKAFELFTGVAPDTERMMSRFMSTTDEAVAKPVGVHSL